MRTLSVLTRLAVKLATAPGFKLQAHVGDIHLGREDGQADGADFDHLRFGEGEHDIEVVDHEVEHDVDIEGARGKDAEPVHLKEHGAVEKRLDGGDGGVKAFQVTDLQDAMTIRSEGDQLVGLFQSRCDGLLDQNVDSRFENRGRDVKMRGSGNADAGRVDSQAGTSGGEALLQAGIHRNRVLGTQGSGSRRIRIDYGSKGDLRSCILQLAEDAHVVLAESAGAKHCDVQNRAVTGWAGV